MSKVIKSCDYPSNVAIQVFAMLNPNKVELIIDEFTGYMYICTDTEPKDLTYTEGW